MNKYFLFLGNCLILPRTSSPPSAAPREEPSTWRGLRPLTGTVRSSATSWRCQRTVSVLTPVCDIAHSYAVLLYNPAATSSFVTDAPWTILMANIDPEAASVIVAGLIPARSYQFRLCAVNDVGKGQFSRETARWARVSWCNEHIFYNS